jgi:hypothetical protein
MREEGAILAPAVRYSVYVVVQIDLLLWLNS